MVDDLVPLIDGIGSMISLEAPRDASAVFLLCTTWWPSDVLVSAAIRCGEHLVKSAQPTTCGPAWPSAIERRAARRVLHGVSGIAWALLALSQISGETKFRQQPCRLAITSAACLIRRKEIGADLRPTAAPRGNPLTAWCHGAPGRLSL